MGLHQNRATHSSAFNDLSKNHEPQDGHEIEQGADDDPQANFIDPFVAEVSPLPIGRFDEMLKALEPAPFGIDFIIDHPGLPDRSRRRYGDGNGCEGFHGLGSFGYLIGIIPETLNIY
jgi:hypothetical protein